ATIGGPERQNHRQGPGRVSGTGQPRARQCHLPDWSAAGVSGGNLCRSEAPRSLRIAVMPVQVDATHLSKVITEVRDLAETVRTYGSGADSTIAFGIPAALHVIAARLESEMRSWAQTEGTLARLFDEQQGGKAIRFPELRAVLTYV